ncbi:blue light receptor, partial [Rhizophlyctis rosea]
MTKSKVFQARQHTSPEGPLSQDQAYPQHHEESTENTDTALPLISSRTSSDLVKSDESPLSAFPNPYYGIYSTSGFNTLPLLSLVATRPNPMIDLGPIDLSSSFIVVDARKHDLPIVYASGSFEDLTGYTGGEILGRNCRFLQSPDGMVERGSVRKHVDNHVVFQLKRSLDDHMECQYININYKKGGEPFVNLITIIPIAFDGNNRPTYFVGFQVDLMQQSKAILRRLEDNSYVIDFNSTDVPSRTSTSSPSFPRLESVDASSPPSSAGDFVSQQSSSPPLVPAPNEYPLKGSDGWLSSPSMFYDGGMKFFGDMDEIGGLGCASG